MGELALRRIETGDVEATVALWERSRRDAQPWLEARMAYRYEDSLRYFRERLLREADVWVAFDGGILVGFMALAPARLEQLFVDPPAQGRGVGTALLDRAKALSPGGLVLFTHQRNARARSFYERRGLRAIAFGISPAPESEPDVEYAWDG